MHHKFNVEVHARTHSRGDHGRKILSSGTKTLFFYSHNENAISNLDYSYVGTFQEIFTGPVHCIHIHSCQYAQ